MLLANNGRACISSACHRPPGGSPKRNGSSMISRCLSIVTPLIHRLIYLLYTRIRVVSTLGKLFPNSPGEIVADPPPVGSVSTSFAPPTGRVIQELFCLLSHTRWTVVTPATPPLIWQSVGPRCACTLKVRPPTTPSSGTGQLEA